MIGDAVKKLLKKYGSEAKKGISRAHNKAKKVSPAYKDITESEEMRKTLAATGVRHTRSEERSIGLADKVLTSAIKRAATTEKGKKILAMKAPEIRKLKSFKDAKKRNPKLNATQFKAYVKSFVDEGSMSRHKRDLSRSRKVKARANKNRAIRQGATATAATVGIGSQFDDNGE